MWPIVLVSGIGVFRVSQVLTGKVAPNAFPSGTKHGSDFYWRFNRAHVNSLESLPIFGVVVLVGVVAHVTNPTFDHLAVAAVVSRVGQSIVHVAGNSNMHVNVRFTFFLAQLLCFVGMAVIAASAIGST